MPDINCPLCKSKGHIFFSYEKHRFLSCDQCQGIFRDPGQILNFEEEKSRYLLHQNHLEDKGYLKFVSPLLQAVQREHPSGAVGLDFGCGHTPVISEVLKGQDYIFDIYDPVFYPQRVFEGKTYDFITCCEVMEHFQHPKKEFDLLAGLLKSDGNLICMTSLYSEEIDFENWYYKNDPTHVFFYRKETLTYIMRNWGFRRLKIEESLLVFLK